jgi:hypothetical protein
VIGAVQRDAGQQDGARCDEHATSGRVRVHGKASISDFTESMSGTGALITLALGHSRGVRCGSDPH